MDKMFTSVGFYDYCVPEKCVSHGNYTKTIKLLYDYGYRTIAINQTITDENAEPKKKKKKGEPREVADIVPTPFEIRTVEGAEDMKILNRLTMEFSNQEFLHKVTKSPNYKKYHILAALPTSTPAFMYTCNNFEADIFSYDPLCKNNVKMNRKLYNQLVERGYHFELLYGPAIEDATKRRNTIQTAHLYHALGKSKNVIVNSGATTPIHIRGPYDIINLGLIFGLSHLQSKMAVTECGKNVYLRSVGRRHGKALMFVTNTDNPATTLATKQEERHDEDMDTEEPAQKRVKHQPC